MRTEIETHHIIVAEPNVIIREGLLQILRQATALHVHAIAVNTNHSLNDMFRVRSFHALFVSPDFDGGFDIQAFRLKHPETPCFAIVSETHQLAAAQSYNGYITIHSDADTIIQAITSSRESTAHISLSDTTSLDALSLREKEILVLLAKGYSNKQVADQLNIALYTVNTHRRNICHKLNIHSLAGLTIYAIAHNLIEL